MALTSRFGAVLGLAAAASMAATPAFAADAPQGLVKQQTQGSALFTGFDENTFNSSTYDGDTDISEWRRGWRRGRGWRRHRGVSAGDVLAGVLIIGGIAAVANAANNNRRRERDVVIVDRDDRRDNREVRRNDSTNGLESAVDQCVERIQQDVRVDSVDSVDRTSRGWVVTGALFNGTGFTCAIDNNGRIDAIDYGNLSESLGTSEDYREGAAQERADGQWDDQRYLAARQARGEALRYEASSTYLASNDTRPAEPLVPLTEERQPAYPGGPVPGEDYPE